MTRPKLIPFQVLARKGKMWRVKALFDGDQALTGWTSASSMMPYKRIKVIRNIFGFGAGGCGFSLHRSYHGLAYISPGTVIRSKPSAQGKIWGKITRHESIYVYFRYRSKWARIVSVGDAFKLSSICSGNRGRAWIPRARLTTRLTPPSSSD